MYCLSHPLMTTCVRFAPPRSRGVFLYDGPVYRHTVLAWLKWIGTQALSLPQEPMHVATVLLRFPTQSYVGGVLGLAVYR